LHGRRSEVLMANPNALDVKDAVINILELVVDRI
jgi:hypothetical protein